MKQKHLPDVWYLNEGDEIEVNDKRFKILKIETRELYDKSHPDYAYEKTFILSEDYFLEFEENGTKLRFGKIKKLGPNNFDYSDDIRIATIKEYLKKKNQYHN